MNNTEATTQPFLGEFPTYTSSDGKQVEIHDVRGLEPPMAHPWPDTQERTFLGWAAVDSGQLVVGDPCYLSLIQPGACASDHPEYNTLFTGTRTDDGSYPVYHLDTDQGTSLWVPIMEATP